MWPNCPNSLKLCMYHHHYIMVQLFMKNNMFIITPCLPHQFDPVPWDQTKDSVCRSLGSRHTQTQGHFTPASHLHFGTISSYLSIQPPRLQSSGNVSKHISLTWLLPHGHAQWHMDGAELLRRFCCWTDLAVAPLSLNTLGILVLCNFDLIDRLID